MLPSHFKQLSSDDVDDVERDVDSFCIVSRSLLAFDVKENLSLFLNVDKCVPVKNKKLLDVLINRLDLNYPPDVNMKNCREFTLCGYGGQQIFVLIVFPSLSENLERLYAKLHHSPDDKDDDSDGEQLQENYEPPADNDGEGESVVGGDGVGGGVRGDGGSGAANCQNDTANATKMWSYAGKSFFVDNVVMPALDKLKRARGKTFLHGSFYSATEKAIKIFQEDFSLFAQSVNEVLQELFQRGVLKHPTQILFYQGTHGLLSDPSIAETAIRNRIFESHKNQLLFIQVHVGCTIKTKKSDKPQLLVYNFNNLKYIISARRSKLIRYRVYNNYSFGHFSVYGTFRPYLNLKSPGIINFIQSYEPGCHIVRNLKKTMSLASFFTCGKLHYLKSGKYCKQLKAVADEFVKTYDQFFEYLTGDTNLLRFEFVHSVFHIDDLFNDFEEDGCIQTSFLNLSDGDFLLPLLETFFDKNIFVQSQGDWWMQFLEERGKYLFSILKDISQSDNLKVPISDDVLCVVHYAEVMLKYFTFGTSKDIPYATFKFCLRSDTEKKSLDDCGIVCFKDMQNLRTDVSSFLIQSKPLIGVRDYFRGIPNFKTYLKTILATTYNTEGTFFITLADQQHLIDDIGFDADEIITFLSKIEYFLKILAISARTYCGVQSEVSRSLVYTNAFKTESIKHALSRKKSRNERVRLRVNGTIDPVVVMHSMKRPLTRFGQIHLSSAFNPGEIEHPLLSRLLMYFVERHVELYLAAFIYADNYFAFNDSQYKWLKVLAFPKPKTISTQTEESSPIVLEEPKLFTMTDLKDLLANVHAIADAFAAKEPHHPLSTLGVQVQCTPDIYLPTANDNRADNSTLHLEDSVDLTSDLETPSTSPMSKSADVSAARRFAIPMSVS